MNDILIYCETIIIVKDFEIYKAQPMDGCRGRCNTRTAKEEEDTQQ